MDNNILGRRQVVSDASARRVQVVPNDLRGCSRFTKLDLGLKTIIPRRSEEKLNPKIALFRFWEKPQGVSRVRKKIIFALELEND